MDVMAIQSALQAAGFDPGPIDGIWGRRTIGAVKGFQARNGLAVEPSVGPQTERVLFSAAGQPADTSGLVWMREARRLLGMAEVAGKASNPVIIDWARELDLAYPDDDVPWCGLFAAHCVAATLPEEPLPTNPLGARQWLKFGTSCQPQAGAILVFWRGAKDGWLGHVAFYVGESTSQYSIIGGNQSDRVSVITLPKERLLGARWPRTAASLATGLVVQAAGALGPVAKLV